MMTNKEITTALRFAGKYIPLKANLINCVTAMAVHSVGVLTPERYVGIRTNVERIHNNMQAGVK